MMAHLTGCKVIVVAVAHGGGAPDRVQNNNSDSEDGADTS
jgi:hypothetical protein